MNIVLTGFMGTGKSVVGRRVAEMLNIPFFDVDETIQRRSGKAIRDLFSEEGEAAFRVLETAAIESLAQQEKAVISTGGGALLLPKNRERLEAHGILVCLSARTSTLLERLKDDLTRPLLAGENVQDKIERLMRERQSLYALCPVQVVTDGKTIAEVTDEVIRQVTPRWETA